MRGHAHDLLWSPPAPDCVGVEMDTAEIGRCLVAIGGALLYFIFLILRGGAVQSAENEN